MRPKAVPWKRSNRRSNSLSILGPLASELSILISTAEKHTDIQVQVSTKVDQIRASAPAPPGVGNKAGQGIGEACSSRCKGSHSTARRHNGIPRTGHCCFCCSFRELYHAKYKRVWRRQQRRPPPLWLSPPLAGRNINVLTNNPLGVVYFLGQQ